MLDKFTLFNLKIFIYYLMYLLCSEIIIVFSIGKNEGELLDILLHSRETEN